MKTRISESPSAYATVSKRKARLNITVDAELLAAAREQGLSLSALMEDKIAQTLKELKRENFRAEIKAYAVEYNKMIEEEGLWSDGMRQF